MFTTLKITNASRQEFVIEIYVTIRYMYINFKDGDIGSERPNYTQPACFTLFNNSFYIFVRKTGFSDNIDFFNTRGVSCLFEQI